MSLHARLLQFLPLLLLAGFIFSTPSMVRGQSIDETLVTAALGIPADKRLKSDPAVYLTWWPTGVSTWSPQSYAVYVKEGRPEDPGTFTLAGLVQPQADPVGVQFLLNRAIRAGEDLDTLSNNIDGLYDQIVPVSSMSLAEKLSAIIAVSEHDPESAETLALLTRRHPAVAMAAGVGFIDTVPLGQVRTYEIRLCPPGANNGADCSVVSGRVTVTGGEIHYLPAPGQPVHVPFVTETDTPDTPDPIIPDPRGNLNVPLRWATPDPLRERSFFQFGFDVYRASAKFAESKGWQLAAPDREEFLATLRSDPLQLKRVNNLPILTDELFNLADAANLTADPKTFYTIDDNNRFEPNGTPFRDGEKFVYFVAAKDLLGRPGQISAGTLVTVCFTLPPQAPSALKVENHYSWDETTDTQKQVFKLTWQPAKTREHGPKIAAYWIYRWESIDQMHQKQGLPFSAIPSGGLTGGRIATVSAGTLEYIDDAGNFPSISYSRQPDLSDPAIVDDAEAGKTYWYSVRAIDDSVCGGNVSGNSAPAFGVLRDRVGPAAPGGSVNGNCLNLVTELDRAYTLPGETFDPRLTYLQMSLLRISDDVDWVEYYVGPINDERAFIGRFYFDATTGETLTITRQFRTDWLYQLDANEWHVYARTGTVDGEISGFAKAQFYPGLQPDPKMNYFVQVADFIAAAEKMEDCQTHSPDPSTPAQSTVTPIKITLNFSPGTEEWKLYRQIDDGPLSLLRQGLGSYDDTPQLVISDSDLPLNGGQICYFLQVFDRHGNPSVLKRIDCITSAPRTPLPQPMLSAIRPIGETPETGGASINWFSAPAGVERFEVWIRSASAMPADVISDSLRLNIPNPPEDHPFLSFQMDDSSEEIYRAYLTGRVGANFQAGPNFTVDWTENFSPGSEYFIRVRAIGAANSVGPWSNEESFIWSSEIDFSQPFDPGDCVVPWPIRGTPLVSEDFPVADVNQHLEVGLEAVINPQNPNGSVAFEGGAVRVGAVELGNLDVNIPDNWNYMPKLPNDGVFQLPVPRNGTLSDAFYQRRDGTSLLNFMLYRYQMPNSDWPSVSGDVYQVSPLIEGIASSDVIIHGQAAKAVHDPYFFLINIPYARNAFHLYVKDTQPVIQGATYRYLVVRFDESGEIAQIIPLQSVTVN